MNTAIMLPMFRGEQIQALLGIDDLSQIVLREEIPIDKLEQALRGLLNEDSKYDKILFESDGEIEISSLRVFYRLPFEAVSLFLNPRNRSWFSKYLVMQTISQTTYIDHENRPPVYVRNPRFWAHNFDRPRDQTSETDNNLVINFGRLLSPVRLMVRAGWDLESEDQRSEEGPRLYKFPTAVGYKLR